MNIDNFLSGIPANLGLVLIAAGMALIAVLLLAAWLFRRKHRDKLATRITAAATLLGLGWSAQGMWDTAVNHYHLETVVAWVLFVVFEAMLAARMLKAHQYRKDQARRGRHVASVWIIACVMALVVSLGEGLQQAPARLAIPLLVAYGWYVDLTADDDPATKPKTSLRWTPRRFALWAGIIEPGAQDAQTINRKRLRDRITRLAFRMDVGATWLNDVFNRDHRLKRLLTLADDADVADVRARLARSRVNLMVAEVPAADEPERTVFVPAPIRRRREEIDLAGKQGVHTRAGRQLRGPELKADVIERMLASVGDNRPDGMTIAELRGLYDPPLGQRTAEAHAAEARKILRSRINGRAG